MAKTSPQIIKASWFTPSTLKQTSDKNPFKKTDYVKQGYTPTANNLNGILTVFEDMPLAYYDIPTANKQLFQRQLWESLAADPELSFRMKETRSFWGEPFHADSLEILLPQVSHKVLSFRVADNGLVRGNVAVVDTPNGNIIYSLSKDGWVGISSRGFGSLEDDQSGNQIVCGSDYIHVSWDFVGVPAVRDAMATVVQHLKQAKIIEPVMQSFRGMGKEKENDFKDLEAILQEESKKTSIVVEKPILNGKVAAGSPTETHVEEREDGTFWIVGPKKEEGKEGIPFEQGPYKTVDEASAKLLMIWLDDIQAEPIDVFSSYLKKRPSTYVLSSKVSFLVNGKRETKRLVSRKKAGEASIFEGSDKLLYIRIDDKKFGPVSRAEAEGIVMKSSKTPKTDKVTSSTKKVIKSNWDWDWEKYGGLSISYNGKDVAFLQGDEASELYDKLEEAPTVEVIETILDPYLDLTDEESGKTYREAVKSSITSSAGEGGEGEEGSAEIDEAEEADRREFSEMVLLELAEALEATDDENVDDYDAFEDLPEDVDLSDIEKIEEGKKPIKSAEGDIEEEDDLLIEDDLYFPTEDDGSVSVDQTSGTITVNTTSSDGDSLTVELQLQDGFLTEVGLDVVDMDDDGEEGEDNSILPGGSLDLFEETNGDVSAAVDKILGLPNETGEGVSVIDLTEGDEEDFDLSMIEQSCGTKKKAKRGKKGSKKGSK